MNTSKLQLSLFSLRISLGLFFLVWAIEKFIKPETTVGIWKAFYLVDNLPLEASYIIGIIQLVVVILFLAGVMKFWTYGFFLVIHTLGTILTYERLMAPYEHINHLFIAAIPCVAALLALFLLREEDTFLTIKRN